jgi:chemotaxis signal transduction protein
MSDRSVIFQIGSNFYSVPFAHVDEIVGTDRVYSKDEIPPAEIPQSEGVEELVSTRFGWVPIIFIYPVEVSPSKDQILILHDETKGGAFPVDQIIGVEDLPEALPFPLPAAKCTDFPIVGVRPWRGRIVLELDLSQLI